MFCKGQQFLQQFLHHNAGIYNGQWSVMFHETNWMRKGNGPGGIIGMTENPQTMATWVYSMDATMTLTGDLKKMAGDEEIIQTTHKEEAAALQSRINLLDSVTHVTGCLINISTGQIAQPNVNVDREINNLSSLSHHGQKASTTRSQTKWWHLLKKKCFCQLARMLL